MVFGTGRNGCGRNIITIVIVKNKHIFVSADGWMKEGAGLICEDLAGHFITGSIGVVGAGRWYFGSIEDIMRCGIGSLCGTDVLATSIEVTFDGRFRYWWM